VQPIWLYHVKLEGKVEDSVVVRCSKLWRGRKAPHVNHEFEARVLKEISGSDFFSELLAFFQTGYCYKFMEGQTYRNMITDTEPWTRPPHDLGMTKGLVKVHNFRLKGESYETTDFFDRYLELIETKYPNGYICEADDIPTKEVILNELKDLIELSKKFPMEIVHCHGDPHPGNFIPKTNGDVYVIDWENTHIGYREYDLAYMCQTIHLYVNRIKEEVTYENSMAIYEEYITAYWRAWKDSSDAVPPKEFIRTVKFCGLVYHIILCAMVGSFHDIQDFDWPLGKTIRETYERYLQFKNHPELQKEIFDS